MEQKGVIKIDGGEVAYFDPRGMDTRGMVNHKPGLFTGDHVSFDLDANGMVCYL